jgi:fluoride exporter
MRFLYIALGGGLGAVLRYIVAVAVSERTGGMFPWGTVVINLTGSLVIGFLFALTERTVIPPGLRLFLMTGVLGGYTTFSTFSLECLTLLKAGETVPFFMNVGISVAGSLVLVYAGYMAAKLILR